MVRWFGGDWGGGCRAMEGDKMEWEALNASERLIAEQAVLGHREVMKAVHSAPRGQGLALTEQAVLAQGRKQMAMMMAEAFKGAAAAEKGGSIAPAADGRHTATTPRSSW